MVSQAAIPQRLRRARLRRRTEHRLVAGVAGGIADSLNAPVAFVRFLFAVATISSPWTIAAYAGAALLLPARDRNRPDWDNLVGAGRLALVFGAPWLATGPIALNELFDESPGVAGASLGLLAVAAAVMFSADYRRGRGRTAEEARATVVSALPVALCALLFAAGMLVLPEVRWERLVPLAAIAGGVALLVTRRRESVAPALLALAAAAVVVASGARLDGGVGDLRVAPSEASGDPIVVRRAAGSMEVDLRRLRNSTAPIRVDASVGMGRLEVILPRWAHARVDARVGRGEIYAVDRDGRFRHHGYDQRVEGLDAGRPGGARIRVEAEVGTGTIEISRIGG
jgi:phage shock protein PspC (stress-responsive transcriptional regulator)